MTEPTGDKLAAMAVGPIGGLIIGVLLWPTGCAVPLPLLTVCPPTERTDILGWTVGGLVGNVSGEGAAFIGIVAGVILWAIAGMFTRKG
jgi:hypothetical protein